MCLTTKKNKAMIAKRDIVVMKYLRKEGEKYCTPCQDTPVELNSTMLPKIDYPEFRDKWSDNFGNEISNLHGGVIHARITPDNMGNCCMKAIIPKGAKYWVDLTTKEIAATELQVTDKPINKTDISIYYDLLENAPESNGIRVGDYQLEDDSFVHPSKNTKNFNVRGIVCGFREDGSPLICAIEILMGVWDKDYNSKIGDFIDDWHEAIKLFNGKEVTNKYKESKDKELEVFEKCINYRKEKNEEWYMPALGEMMTLLDNVIFLNAACNITGLGREISTYEWFWTCSEYYSRDSWFCYHSRSGVYCGWGYKGYRGSIVPFFASTTTGKEKKNKKSLKEKLSSLWK